jgi:hypothetical protein
VTAQERVVRPARDGIAVVDDKTVRVAELGTAASSAVDCYSCREVTLNYSDSLLFHGGDTGSTPVRERHSTSIIYRRDLGQQLWCLAQLALIH